MRQTAKQHGADSADEPKGVRRRDAGLPRGRLCPKQGAFSARTAPGAMRTAPPGSLAPQDLRLKKQQPLEYNLVISRSREAPSQLNPNDRDCGGAFSLLYCVWAKKSSRVSNRI